MKINGFTVTSNVFDEIDSTSCHLGLDGCLRLVHLSDTEFNTIEELKTAIEALTF